MNKFPLKSGLVSVLLMLGLISIVLLSACSSSPSSTTSTGSTSTGSTSTGSTGSTSTGSTGSTSTSTGSSGSTSTSASSGQTFQTLASSGESTYSSTCAVCHGTNGEGTQVCPVTLWGTGTGLGSYNGVTLFTDAQGMLSYISSKMPLSAPGSLSTQQSEELLAFILLKGNLVSSSTVFDASKLGSISIP